MGYIYDVLENQFIQVDTPNVGIPQLMWHITNRCRLNCKFCFSKKNVDEVNIVDLDQYIQKFCALKVQKIDISGGEPLLYVGFPEICEALFEAGIYITITTRAFGLESNEKYLLNNCERFARIIVSFDVPFEEPFVVLSGKREAWNKTMEFLQKLRKKQCSNIRVNTVVTSYLLDDLYLSEMVGIIKQGYCKEWCLIEPHPANRKITFDEVNIQHNQFEDVIRKAKRISKNDSGYRLLVRELKNYTDYWVLYPDGILAKHTDGDQDERGLLFLETANDDVLNVSKNKIWVPEGEE